jgi:hypothetical protein
VDFYIIEVLMSMMSVSAMMLIAVVLVRINKNYEKSQKWNLRTYTQDVLERNKDKMTHVKLLREFEPKSLSDLDEELRQELFATLNYFELLSSGIHQGMYDEDIVKLNNKGIMTAILFNYINVIEHMRHESNSSELFAEYEYLVKRWRNERPSAKFSNSLRVSKED